MALIEVPDELLSDVLKLVVDKKREHTPYYSDIDRFIANKPSNDYVEYWGDEVTLKRNWQSDPDHPECFLAYITVAEAKLLRSIGLGYSDINHEWKQHYDINGIPSFNGYGEGDADAGGGLGSGNAGAGQSSEGESEAGGFGGEGEDGSYGPSGYDTSSDFSTDFNELSTQLDALESMLSGKSTFEDFTKTISNPASYTSLGGEITTSKEYDRGYAQASTSPDDSKDFSSSFAEAFDKGAFDAFSGIADSSIDAVGGISGFLNEIFGLSLDTHIGINGKEVGMFAELAIDLAELSGATVSTNEASIADAIVDGLVGIGMSVALGATEFSIGLSTAASITSSYADIGLSLGTVSATEYASLKATTSVIGLVSTSLQAMQTVQALSKAPNTMLSTDTKVAMYAVELSKVTVDFMHVNSMLADIGLTVYDITELDFITFDSTTDSGLYTGGGVENFVEFKRTILAKEDEEYIADPFEWMAGGSMFDSQLAGNDYYANTNVYNSNNIANMNLPLSNLDRVTLIATDSIYNNLLPFKEM